MKKRIAILGSTGSIGKSLLKIISKDKKNFQILLLSANQKGIKFKIIRHEDKRNAFTQKILRYFKKD